MNLIYHILKFKLLSFAKLNVNFSFDNLLKNVGSFFVYTIFAIGAFIFSYEAVKYLLEQFNIGLFLLHEFFSITLFIFFIAVNIGNIIVSYSTLYKSQEVNYLFTKPIPPSTIFVIKFFDNFLYSSSTLILNITFCSWRLCILSRLFGVGCCCIIPIEFCSLYALGCIAWYYRTSTLSKALYSHRN
ncbi:MAG: hypothetical protein U5K00_03665 [Melioribacteraceae bacterium]|nr:hypothetical protein [Melioribacteraceae bacterium]